MTETAVAEREHRHKRSSRALVDSRRFALADLACALTAAALWYISDGRLGPWPLLIAAIPWVFRVAQGRYPLKVTRFDLPLAAFLVSAGVAAWVAYNQDIAWGKFWLIVGATVLFYALAGQRSANLWPIATGMGVFGAAVAVYFLLTHDWVASPAKVAAINNVALSWSSFRPGFFAGFHQLHPNVAGGLMALFFPFALATAVRGIQKDKIWMAVTGIGAGLLGLLGLMLTTSRGAWLALAAGLAAWAVWALTGPLHRRLNLSRRLVLGLFLALALVGLVALAFLTAGGLVGLLDRLPGPSTVGSRLTISREALHLAGDFPFTGGGLGSFDGLYSQYIRVIPNHFLIHGHNLFLNVAVEQGFFALFLLLSMLAAAFWWLADPHHAQAKRSIRGLNLLAGSTFAALVVICVHGLGEDPLYGSRGLLFLWVPFGLTAVLFPRRQGIIERFHAAERPALITIAILVLLVTGFLIVNRGQLLSAWASNRGALAMAQVELEGYPRNAWSDGREVPLLNGAIQQFERALSLNAGNRTAWHRLGLIALLERDFDTAKADLTKAYLIDNTHRGIRKSLGYATTWTGNSTGGALLLAELPETAGELNIYSWWWGTQGRDDLGQYAADAALQLAGQPPNP
jgi:tetratricopeptide (TPR) repeat protein